MRTAICSLFLAAALLLIMGGCHAADDNTPQSRVPSSLAAPTPGLGRRLMSLGKMTCSQCEGHGNTYDCPRNEAELRRIIAKWGYAETVDMCCKKALPKFTYGSSGADSMSAHTLWWAKTTRDCVGAIRTKYTLSADGSTLTTSMSGGFVCPDENWPTYECVYE